MLCETATAKTLWATVFSSNSQRALVHSTVHQEDQEETEATVGRQSRTSSLYKDICMV